MQKTFEALDNALIERLFQPALTLITHQIGFSRTTAACFFIDAASFSWLVSRGQTVTDAVVAWNATASLADIVLILLGLGAMTSLRLLFRRAADKHVSPLRLIMQPHRAVVLLMLVARLVQLRSLGLADAAELAMLSCAASALYLSACTEQPPVRRILGRLMSAG